MAFRSEFQFEESFSRNCIVEQEEYLTELFGCSHLCHSGFGYDRSMKIR